MNRVFLLFVLIALSTGVVASQEPQPEGFEGYADIARWMSEQSDPKMRAAGWSYLARHANVLGGPDPEAYLEQVRQLIAGDPSAATLLLLAQGCRVLGVIPECDDAGIPEAVRRNAGGNPLILGVFHNQDSEAFREILIEAESINAHAGLEALLWYQAVQNGPHPSPQGLPPFQVALSIGLSSLPPMAGTAERCRAAVATDEALDKACQRLTVQMRDAKTLLLQNLGLGLARERALTLGEQKRAAELQVEQEAMQGRLMCLVESAEPALNDADDALYTRFLEVLIERGELAAFEFVAGDDAEDCVGSGS